MGKLWHEVRDPVHGFVRLEERERPIVGSPPVQRLRYIHQLALSYLIYPGATHRRFEHVLGVAELAGRAFDVLTAPDHLDGSVRELIKELNNLDDLRHWKRNVRMGALCHDIGHLPFSHAGESLLPDGWKHERLSHDLVLSPEMEQLWAADEPKLTPDVIAKIAVGPSKHAGPFSVWEAILSEIVVGDAFGVDRIDYLLRDALHCGVAYGRFDHLRLIDELRILAVDRGADEAPEPVLGIDEGGLQAAEGMLLARYFMYTGVYFHQVRQVYNLHLEDFLKNWLDGGQFSVNLEDHLNMTDNEVLTAMRIAARDPAALGHDSARRIIERDHFKLAYDRTPDEMNIFQNAGEAIGAALKQKYGAENVLTYSGGGGGGNVDFPVRLYDGRIESSLTLSPTLRSLPATRTDRVWVEPSIVGNARNWLNDDRRKQILQDAAENTQEETS
jgi:HD superfamily phosphohydrolase